MCVWRLRNHKEVETLCEELSGIYDAKTIMAMYDYATQEPFSFMFVRLDAKTRRDMFWLRFEARISPQEETDDATDEPEQHAGPRPIPGKGAGKP